jgi:hypothetical protein
MHCIARECSTMQDLLEEVGADINDVNNRGEKIWRLLIA